MSESSDAADVALGSGVVLAAGVVEQSARLALTGWLAATLGAAAFGRYAWVVTVAVLLGTLSPLGLQSAVVLFGARHLANGDFGRLRGAVGVALLGTVGAGVLVALGLLAAAPFAPPDLAPHLPHVAPVVVLHALLVALMNAGRAIRDLRPQVLAYQALLPLGLLVGSIAAVTAGGGIDGVLEAFVVSYAVATGFAGWLLVTRLHPMLGAAPPVLEARAMLAFALPQGLSDLLSKLVLWMDVLLLAPLAGAEQVGLYRLAASIAFIGSLPMFAVHTAFHPIVAERVAKGELERLNTVLRTVTRWLVLLSAGPFLAILLLPDVVLGWFDGAYVAAAPALVVLLLGQCVHVACAATAPLVPMSGRSRLELVNSLGALAIVGIGNLVLVPRLGAVGAATASALAFTAWSVARVVEARLLLGCFPFDVRTSWLLVFTVVLGVVVAGAGRGEPVAVRMALTAGALALYAAFAWRRVVDPHDAAALRAVLGRFRGVTSR